MPLEIKDEPKVVAKKAKSNDDSDDAKAILEQMQAKEDNGDCAFC